MHLCAMNLRSDEGISGFLNEEVTAGARGQIEGVSVRLEVTASIGYSPHFTWSVLW